MVSAAPFRKRGSETGAQRCATRAEKTLAIDIALLAFLILLNAVFAMCEIAVVSSRKARLQRLADSGRPGAPAALVLHEEPSRFLSTIQVGITSVGILSGAVGEAALADPLRDWLRTVPAIEPWSSSVALTVVVVALTYDSVVVGELVPKRLGLLAPEAIASLVARPMNAWGESLDWTRARVCINSLQATPERNGESLLVLSERDPGHPNWVRLLGQRSGTMSIRFARMRVGEAMPAVHTKVVKT